VSREQGAAGTARRGFGEAPATAGLTNGERERMREGERARVNRERGGLVRFL
jgi:hypothetical protein